MAFLRALNLGLLAGVVLLCSSAIAIAQQYPDRPIKVIVPLGVGAASDAAVRYIVEKMGPAMKGNFVIENRPGAGGNVGASAAAKAAPDGYTLFVGGTGQMVLNPFIYSNLDFDYEKSFEPIALLNDAPYVIAANVDFPANNIPELIAIAKAKPDSVNTAISSTSGRVISDLFQKASGVSLFSVNYPSPSPAVVDLASGRVSLMIETAASMKSIIKTGKVKILAVTTLKSSPLVPGVKSIEEQGVHGFGQYTGMIALWAPRNTPRAIIELLSAQVNRVVALPETKAFMADLGAEAAAPGTPHELGALAARDRLRFGPIIRAANITPN